MTTVWDTILAKGAIALYKGAEASGTTMVDSSGNGRDGTIDAGVTLGATGIIPNVPLEPGWALNAAEGGSVTGASWMAPATAFTAIVFLKLSSLPSGTAVVLARSDINASSIMGNKAWSIQVGNTGIVNGRVFNNSNASVAPSSAAGAVAAGSLVMLAVSHDGTTVKYRKNGSSLIASAALGGAPVSFANNTKPFTMGRDATTGVAALNGTIKGGAFFPTALSDADLDAIWAAAIADPALEIQVQAVVPKTTAAFDLRGLPVHGAWSWWTRPRAVAVGGKIYLGYTTQLLPTAGIVVAQYDDDGRFETQHQVHLVGTYDDHNNPALFMEEGHDPFVLWNNHNVDDDQHFSYGTQPIEDGFTSGSEVLFDTVGLTTYAALHRTDDGTLYVVFRSGSTAWNIITSTDDGVTWGDERKVVSSTLQMYVASVLAADGRIRLAATVHPREATLQSIYYAELDPVTGTLYGRDGVTVIGTAGGSAPSMTAWNIAASPTTGYHTWVYDVSPGEDREITWAQMNDPSTPTITEYFYTTDQGGSWTSHKVVDAGVPFGSEAIPDEGGNYLGGVQFAQPGSLVVAREDTGTWYVEYWHTTDGGATWDTEVITTSTTKRLARAWKVEPRDGTPADFVAVNVITPPYDSYTDHTTRIGLFAAPPLPTPEVEVQAVVPATTASFTLAVSADMTIDAVVPATTAAFVLDSADVSPWVQAVLDLGADVLWWARLNDGEGSDGPTGGAAVLADSSGNGHDGTYAGAWHVSDPLVGAGHSVTFDQSTLGFSGHADVDPAGWLDAANGPDEFTLIFWGVRTVTGSGDAFDRDHDGDAVVQVALGQTTEATLLLTSGLASINETLVPTGLHMWAITYQVDTVSGYKMWRNAVQRASLNTIGGATPDWGDATLRLGSASIPTDVPMDEALIVGRALTGAELLDLYLAGAVWEVEVEAVVPATVASFALTVVPAVQVQAVVPATTASFTMLAAVDMTVQAVVPATTASFSITALRNITVQAVVPKTTASFALSLGRNVVIQAVVPATIAEFVLAPQATVEVQAVVPATTALIRLDFPPATDTTNRVGGRSRSGLGVASWEPPVAPVPIPWAPLPPRSKIVAQAFTTPTISTSGRPVYDVTLAEQGALRDRILVGNTDVTYLRGVPTPFPGYGLTEPLMYGPTALSFPQISTFEVAGEGDLKWLDVGKAVYLQRVDPDTDAVVYEDYVGVVVGIDVEGPNMVAQIGGEAMGRAALVNRQVPIWTGFQDIGRYMYSAFKDLGLRLTPYLGPETGVRLQRFGGQSVLDYISELVARSWNRQGNRWTVMPDQDASTRGVYKMRRKDTTTIHATAYSDDARVRVSLHRDAAEEPNRIYGTGITPAGMQVRNGVYPGLVQTPPPPYPFNDNRDFGEGTTDADTDTGDGITLMIRRLIIVKKLDQEDTPGGYDAQVTRAIRALQEDAGETFTTGIMDVDTWRALYDLDVTGYSLRWAHIEPMAQHSYVAPWRRSGSGGIRGRNPRYRPAALKRDRNIDYGTGLTLDQMLDHSKAELGEADEKNWTGSVTFLTGALIDGEHNPGDPLTDADVLPARNLRPGQNLWLPVFDGGTLFHIAAVNVGADGTVSVDVDTRARDAMEVWEVIARNRESRKSPARAWHVAGEQRSSTMTKDSIGIWDEVGGLLGDTVHVPARTWVVFPVVAGQEGTVQQIILRTSPAAEFVVGVFGDTIYSSRLHSLVGDPLTHAGKLRWANEDVRDALRMVNLLLYVAGEKEAPCGYYPNTKHVEDDPDTPTEETGTNALTGRWEDQAGFAYYTGQHAVLWVAVFADRATTIPAGRIMRNQLEAGV